MEKISASTHSRNISRNGWSKTIVFAKAPKQILAELDNGALAKTIVFDQPFLEMFLECVDAEIFSI